MRNLSIKSLLFYWLFQVATALTIREIINRRTELQELNRFMSNVALLSDLGFASSHKYTCFLPHNDAFKKIPESIYQKYLSTSSNVKKEFDDIMKYHCVLSIQGNVIYSNSIGDDIYQSMADGAPNIYLKQIGNKYYVNGALIVEPDIQASNGIVHLIDHFNYDIGSTMNAYKFIDHHRQTSVEPSTRSFFQLLESYQTMMANTNPGELDATKYMNHHERVTVFIPTNAAIAKIPTQALGLLSRDPSNLRKVIESHVILDSVQHSNILAQSLNQEITAMSGRIIPKVFGPNMYVSNNCAQGRLTNANITLSNGVIHMIDGILGYVFNDAHEEIDQDSMLTQMYGHIRSAATEIEASLQVPPGVTRDIPTNQQITVFAPIDSAFLDVDLTQDPDKLNEVLKMHMIPGRIELSDMLDGVQRETKVRDMYAKFSREGEDTFVEIDHVKGKIVDGDICVKNGIIHKVDTVLGFTSSTAMSVIDSDPDLQCVQFLLEESFYKAIRSSGKSGYLSDPTKRLTIFAPTERAFEIMRTGSLGRKLLDSDNSGNLVNVLNRHILSQEFYTDELTVGNKRILETLFDAVEIEKRGPKDIYLLFGNGIKLVKYDVRVSNGVIHYIEAVMYSEGNPNASEWVGAANTCYISLVLLFSLQIVAILM